MAGLKDLNIAWPPLLLTEDELEFCGQYADPEKPGVLRRVYSGTLVRPRNIAGETDALIYTYKPSGRFTRVFAVTFTGDVLFWEVKLRTDPGEVLITDYTAVSALTNQGSWGRASFVVPYANQFEGSYATGGTPPGPLLFEPNIALEGTSNLYFEGRVVPEWDALTTPQALTRAVLNVAVHVWEFPQMPRQRGIGGTGRRPARPSANKGEKK